MSLRAEIEKAWYGSPGLLYVLLPLEWLFRIVSACRRKRTLAQDCGAPVVVVGNIAIGGSGKTPLVLALAEALGERGYRVGIVSRGFGGKAERYPLLVTPNTDPRLCGDEPLLLALRSGCPLAVAPDRPAAAAALVNQGCNLILSDDGLQHYRLARTLEVVVVDGRRGLGNGHCLPVGPLREPGGRIAEADFCVVNGAPSAFTRRDSYQMNLRGDTLIALSGQEQVSLEAWPTAHRRIHAVAGIGHPTRFFDSLRNSGFDVIEHPFSDHHAFTDQDFSFNDNLPILMTEKDAVKCRQFALQNAWYLPINAELDGDFVNALCQRLLQTQH